MSEPALASAYRAIRARLGAGGEPWGARVYGDVIPAGAEWPVVTYFWSGGGERYTRRTPDANLVITVKAISESQAEAFTLAGRIAALLNDSGEADYRNDALTAGSEWRILSVSQEDAVHLVEMWAGAQPLYHEGARYRFIMEEV